MGDLFDNYGINNQGILSVTPAEALKLYHKGALIVDLRELDFSDYKAFDLKGVLHFPLSEIENRYNELPADAYLILADSTGLKSRKMVNFLKQNGFEHVASLAGGFVEWERDNMPVRTDKNERLTGACACQLKPRERDK